MYEDEPVLQAFKVMRRKKIGGIPVVDRSGNKAIGNISLRDIQYLLTAPEIYHDCRFVPKALHGITLPEFLLSLNVLIQIQIHHCIRSITAKDFLISVSNYLQKNNNESPSPVVNGLVTCTKDHSIKELIQLLDSKKIHRIYVEDGKGNLEGVITLRDIISRLVDEPRGYFGDFFDGVLPLPSSCRV